MSKKDQNSAPSQTDEANQSGTNGQNGNDQSVGAQVAHKVEEVADQAKQTATGLVGTVKHQAASRLDKQKDHAVEELASVAESVRLMGEQLKAPEHGAVAHYAAQYGDMAADQLQEVAGYLRQHDVKQLVREVEGFARREPLLFTGGAFLLGLIGARFLKSKPVQEETYSAPIPAQPITINPVPTPDFASLADETPFGDEYLVGESLDDATLDGTSLDAELMNDSMDIAADPLLDEDEFSSAQETTPDQVAPPIDIKP